MYEVAGNVIAGNVDPIEANSDEYVHWDVDLIDQILELANMHGNNISIVINAAWEYYAPIFVYRQSDQEFTTTSFFEVLHTAAEKTGIAIENFTYITANFKMWKWYNDWKTEVRPNDGSANIVCDLVFFHLVNPEINAKSVVPTIANRTFDKVYNCFSNNFYHHKMSIFKRLYTANLLDYGFCSFINYKKYGMLGETLTDEQLEMLPLNLDFDETQQQQYGSFDEFMRNTQLHDHYLSEDNDMRFTTDLKNPCVERQKLHIDQYVEDSFCSFVVESVTGLPERLWHETSDSLPDNHNVVSAAVSDSAYKFMQYGGISEKIVRPIKVGSPFLLFAAPYTLDLLKQLGYKTFDLWWDESYDTIHCPLKRMDAIIQILQDLSDKPTSELEDMYTAMMPVLQHNQQLLMSTTSAISLTKDDLITYSENWSFVDAYYYTSHACENKNL